MLRLTVAPRSTLGGFRSWVVTDCPVAPGLRPGHLAEIAAVRRDADQRAALVAAELDKAAERAARDAQLAREEITEARAAEAAVREELDRVRLDAAAHAAQALDFAAREKEELRAWAERQADGLHAELAQARADAARMVTEVRNASATQVTALKQAHSDLRDANARLATALEAAHRPRRSGGARGKHDGSQTKRDQMIELAGQRYDLQAIPLEEVSTAANEIAAEISYSASTARRELLRHVRELQAAGPVPTAAVPPITTEADDPITTEADDPWL
jgi:hypothetical protein